MLDDPRDRGTYKIAIAMLGLALVVAVAGACWVAAEFGSSGNIPTELWFIPAAVGGVFVGALIPFSTQTRNPNPPESPRRKDPNSTGPDRVHVHDPVVGARLLLLAAIMTGTIGAAVDHGHLLALCGVGAALGGVFFGLFIPSPGRRDP